MAELLHNPSILAKANKNYLKKSLHVKSSKNRTSLASVLSRSNKRSTEAAPHSTNPRAHQTEQEVEIHGFTIPKHTQVFVNAWSILRDPAYWDDPPALSPTGF
ncbi:UNVERIFIED_CONTAM: cytochrome [Sesamum angustifolium]|uniref:Cytochrome n=1 Tax=Sesamum angustifolium TaxID=2727405 RepID=A0AAW2IS70_9LAMI